MRGDNTENLYGKPNDVHEKRAESPLSTYVKLATATANATIAFGKSLMRYEAEHKECFVWDAMPDMESYEALSEEKLDSIVSRCISLLMKEQVVDKRSKKPLYLVRQGNQWGAIHRVLADEYGYPQEQKAFFRRMKQMGWADEDKRMPCKYANLKKAPKFTLLKFEEWKADFCSGMREKATFYKQYDVAKRMKELLMQHILQERKNPNEFFP